MSRSFIPDTDHGALEWMQVFSQGITAAPATYGLVAADATAIANVVNAYAAAYAANIDPATKTKVTVIAKNNTRAAAESVCRQYAAVIKHNAGVTDENKAAIGVPPINNQHAPVPVPGTPPLLNVLGAIDGGHVVRFADAITPDSGAKPVGAASLQLFVAVGEAVVTDPDVAEFQGIHSRNGIDLSYGAAESGKYATYFGRWCGVRGDVGPWSKPASMRIAA